MLIFACACSWTYSQSNFLWRAGSNGNDEALANTIDLSGNIYTTGYFSLYARFDTTVLASSGGGDIFVMKQNASGNVMWAVKAGGNNSDRATSIGSDAAGNIYVCGYFSGTATFGSIQLTSVSNTEDIFVAKLNPSGSFLWAQRFGGDNIELALGLTIDRANNIIVTGQFKDTVTFGSTTLYSTINPNNNLPSYDIFLLKLNSAGSFIWVKQGAAKFDSRGLAVASDDSCNVYLTGQFSDTLHFSNWYYNTGYNIGFILKFDSSGQDVWFKRLLASYVTAYSITNSAGGVYITGDYLGQLNIQNSPPVILTNPNPNKIFLVKVSHSGGVVWGKSEGSVSQISSLDVAADTSGNPYITGTFKCRFTDYSALYDSAIFYSVGARDVFTAKYSSSGQRVWQRHFAGPRDDYCSAISVIDDNNPVIAGSYERNFNVPRGNNFSFNISNHDSSSYGPNQFSTYCSSLNYDRYISVSSEGFKDIFSARPVDTLRNLYDYYDRMDTNCVRDTLVPYINNNQDTIVGCDRVLLFTSRRTGRDGVIGPEYTYLWSNGGTRDTTYVYSTGWYSLTLQRKDHCLNSVTDSVYVVIYPTPSPPMISNVGGFMNSAIPIYNCLQKMVIVYPDTAYLIGSNVPPGYSSYWSTPSGNIYSDTIMVADTGYFSFVVVSPDGNCSSSTCVYVMIAYFSTGWCPGNFVPEIHFTDSLSDATDTVEICYGDHFEMVLTDSTMWANGNIVANIIAYANWQLSGGFGFHYYHSFPTTFIEHRQLFHGYTSGNCSVTVTIIDPVFGTPYAIVVRNFYLLVNPLPPANAQWGGPQFFCPGDTATLTLSSGYHYSSITGPLPFSVSSDSTNVFAVQPGTFTATYSVTDSITGCTNGDTITFDLQSSPPPTVTMIPSNGIICPNDSVLLIAENGSNYVWYGSLPTPIGTSQSIYVSTPGLYHYTFTDSTGCHLVSETVELREYSTPTLTAFPNSVLCPGDSVTITVSEWDSTGIQWLPPLSGSGLTQVVYAPGTYSCQITACNITDTVSIIVTASTVNAQITANGPSQICPGDSVILQGPTGMASYTWLPGNLNGEFIIATMPGTYILQVMDFNGCSAGDTIVVDSISNPPPPVVTDTLICAGQSVLLSASGSGTIRWYDSQSASVPLFTGNSYQTPVIDSTTTLYVTNSDTLCESIRVPVNIFVNPLSLPPPIYGDSLYCINDTLVLYVNLLPGFTCSWTGPNNFQATTDSISLVLTDTSLTGYYSVTISDSNCTSLPDSILISFYPQQNISINISGNNPHCPGTDVTLTSSINLSSYFWAPTGDTTSSIIVSDTGTFVLIGIDQFGCADTSQQISVSQLPEPIPPSVNDTTVCYGISVLFSQSVSGVLTWYSSNGDSLYTGNVYLTSSLTDTTVFYIALTDSNGCMSAQDTFTVFVFPLPPAPAVSSNAPLCEGDTLFLFTNFVSGASYSWTGPNSFVSSAQNPVIPNATIAHAGTYSLQLTENGCISAANSLVVIINPLPPSPILSGDSIYCEGQTIQLTVTNTSGSITWTGPNNFQSSSVSISIGPADNSHNGIYTVTTTLNGCSSSSSISIQVFGLPVFSINANSPVCAGNTLVFSASLLTGAAYQWTGPNNFTSSIWQNNILNSDTSLNGYYHVSVSINGCASAVDSVLLTVIPYPVFDLGNDTTFCKGRQIALAAPAGFDLYNWNTGETVRSLIVSVSGTYILTATNNPDCSTSDSVEITVSSCDPVVPNVFTPNNDGYNDEFYITFEGAAPIDMDIYNRWGELVRQLSGSILKWDGKNNAGRDVPDGVYYYICHYINNYSEMQTFTGFVELIR
ncbi:MAG TPA: gliding motility-associated C-terminal domain-containing protein [Bacteroidia bacterium]|nr:gliding motility-associated C-terminal domain-containing protein [Bacteroidia bacterium]